MNTYRQYLTTLRRVPDDIVLSVASREIIPASPGECICGWALREYIGGLSRQPAETVDSHGSEAKALAPSECGTPARCLAAFGGTHEAWAALFYGICNSDEMPHIERAFVARVLEAVG